MTNTHPLVGVWDLTPQLPLAAAGLPAYARGALATVQHACTSAGLDTLKVCLKHSFEMCTAAITAAGLPAGARGAVATVLLKLPLLRHVYAWMGCIPADYHTIHEKLQTTSVGLVPEVHFYKSSLWIYITRRI